MISRRRISRSLVTVLTLALFQIVSPFSTLFTTPANAAITQINIENGTSYGGTGGTASSPSLCSNGAVTGLKASSTVGTYSYGFGFTCTPFASDGSLGSPSTYTDVVTTSARDLSQSCPAGQVGIGIKVRVNSSMVAEFALKCGNPMSQNNSSTLDLIPNTITNGTDSTYTCAAGKVLVGFTGKFGAGVDQLTPRCASYSGFVYAGIGAPVITNTSFRVASVAFTALANNYADTNLTYTVTATPPSGPAITGTGQLSPISVSGLSSGINYTYTVTGSNAYGATAAATGSASLTSLTSTNYETDTALLLDGTQVAWKSDTGTGGLLDISNAITLEAWVNPSEKVAGTQYAVICKQNSFELFHIDGIWKYALAGTTTDWGAGISTDIPVFVDQWQHVAISRSANTNIVNFYLNGALVYSGTANGAASGALRDTDSPLTVGACIQSAPVAPADPTSAFRYKGKVDQVAIFASARTEPEIASDMNKHLAQLSPAPRIFYDFNEGGGSVLYNRVPFSAEATDLTLAGTFTSSNWPDVKTVTSTSTYQTITFPRTYITAIGGWKIPAGVKSVTSVVVAGGGGGDGETDFTGWLGGGGGGGGYRLVTTSVNAGDTATVQVGQGGRRGKDTAAQTANLETASNGGNSIFGPTTSIGGGAGGARSADGVNVNQANGAAGGSGGGGGTYSGTGGLGTSGQGNNGGSSDGNCCAGAGGGGAGTQGGNTSLTGSGQGGNAGDGVLNPLYISTVNAQYLAGGGAGGGTSTNGSAGTKGGVPWKSNASANTGAGGGGGGGGGTHYPGGYGGSGVVIVRYITVTIEPVFTGPNYETTTSGLTVSLSVSGTPTSPLVRSYQWQTSSDTGTTWVNAATGTGLLTATYTTQVLTTSLSGSRYQYRVVVTDTDTAGLYVSKNSPEIYIVVNPLITFSGTYTTQKYGVTHTDTFTTTVGTGTGNKTFAFTPNNRSYITWDTSTVNTAALTVNRLLGPGTYYETMTATDTKGSQSSQMLTIVVSKADTVTVSALAVSDTHTGSALTFTNRYSVTGLVNSDTVTSISYTYAGTANGGVSYLSSATRPISAGSYTITPVPVIANSDSYTAVLVDTSTLTINRGSRTLTISTKPSSLKYGSTSTLGITTSGASDGAITYTSNTTSLCSFASAVLTALTGTGSCTYYARIGQGNNWETATSQTESTTLAKADTLTVTVNAITPLTYTAQSAIVTPTATVSGLKLTDTVTANSVSYQYGTTTVTGGNSTTTWSLTAPVDADLYSIQPYGLALASGYSNNYEGTTYVNGSLRINRAQQAALNISQYSAIFGQQYKVQIFGGSGTGAISATVSAGSALNCSISGDTLTTTSVGSCWLVAQKNGDKNYETQTASIFVYFLDWIPYIAPVVISNSPTVALESVVPITRDPNAAPLVTTVGASGDATYPVAINGQGFTNDTVANTKVKFWRGVVVPLGDYIVKSDILIWSKVPVAATAGRVAVTNSNGTGASTNTFSP